MYFVYILECQDGTLYTGITTDIARRLAEHKNNQGGHYTRAHGAKKIIYSEKMATRSHALKREGKVKKMQRKQKLLLAKMI